MFSSRHLLVGAGACALVLSSCSGGGGSSSSAPTVSPAPAPTVAPTPAPTPLGLSGLKLNGETADGTLSLTVLEGGRVALTIDAQGDGTLEVTIEQTSGPLLDFSGFQDTADTVASAGLTATLVQSTGNIVSSGKRLVDLIGFVPDLVVDGTVTLKVTVSDGTDTIEQNISFDVRNQDYAASTIFDSVSQTITAPAGVRALQSIDRINAAVDFGGFQLPVQSRHLSGLSVSTDGTSQLFKFESDGNTVYGPVTTTDAGTISFFDTPSRLTSEALDLDAVNGPTDPLIANSVSETILFADHFPGTGLGTASNEAVANICNVNAGEVTDAGGGNVSTDLLLGTTNGLLRKRRENLGSVVFTDKPAIASTGNYCHIVTGTSFTTAPSVTTYWLDPSTLKVSKIVAGNENYVPEAARDIDAALNPSEYSVALFSGEIDAAGRGTVFAVLTDNSDTSKQLLYIARNTNGTTSELEWGDPVALDMTPPTDGQLTSFAFAIEFITLVSPEQDTALIIDDIGTIGTLPVDTSAADIRTIDVGRGFAHVEPIAVDFGDIIGLAFASADDGEIQIRFY